jgi:hypothetical protein
LGTPVSSVTSASMNASATIRTLSRRKSTSPSALALGSISSTAILSSAIVALLRRRFSLQRREEDAMAIVLVGQVQLLHNGGGRDHVVGNRW